MTRFGPHRLEYWRLSSSERATVLDEAVPFLTPKVIYPGREWVERWAWVESQFGPEALIISASIYNFDTTRLWAYIDEGFRFKREADAIMYMLRWVG